MIRVSAEADLADRLFFGANRDRRLRLRKPFVGEYEQEFRQFGMHEENRRRVIVARVIVTARLPFSQSRRHRIDFMRIPFLLFADETVEDRDDVLAPILDEIMCDAAGGYGMKRK